MRELENTVLGGKNTFPSISSLIGRVLSIFGQKTDKRHTLEMDFKVLTPAQTFHEVTKATYIKNP